MVRPRRGSHLRSLSLRAEQGLVNPNARVDVRLLGPCFKTGRLRPLRQRPCPPEGGRRGTLGPGGPHSASVCKHPSREGAVTFPTPFDGRAGPALACPRTSEPVLRGGPG